MRKQEDGETVDSFITALYELVENCNYGLLREEMIRDRLVVGIKDVKLSERLQLDNALTLEKAIAEARQTETVRQQQPLLRGGTESKSTSEAPVGAVNKKPATSKPTHNKKPERKSKLREGHVVAVANTPLMIVSTVQHEMQFATSVVNEVIFNLSAETDPQYQ